MIIKHPEFDHWMVSDLALPNFYGKWKVAMEHASKSYEKYSFNWWMLARRHYLELGGYYKWQLPPQVAP